MPIRKLPSVRPSVRPSTGPSARHYSLRKEALSLHPKCTPTHSPRAKTTPSFKRGNGVASEVVPAVSVAVALVALTPKGAAVVVVVVVFMVVISDVFDAPAPTTAADADASRKL